MVHTWREETDGDNDIDKATAREIVDKFRRFATILVAEWGRVIYMTTDETSIPTGIAQSQMLLPPLRAFSLCHHVLDR